MINNPNSFTDIFQRYDLVRFVFNDQVYTGHIDKVDEVVITVNAKPVDIYDKSLGPMGKWLIDDHVFDLFNVEWLDDHRGGDNSAIGVSPSWKDMSWITKHFEDHA